MIAHYQPLADSNQTLGRRHALKMLVAAGAGMIADLRQDREARPPEEQHPRSLRGRELAKVARSITIKRDLVFARRPERALRLDVYSPSKQMQGPFPAILTIGVAAWKYQRKDFQLDLDRLFPEPTPFLYPPCLAPRGYVVVSAECRVSGEAIFPAQVHDCKCAVRWIREHAHEFNIDPARIGIMGASASGHLAALLAVTNDTQELEGGVCYPRHSSRVSAAFCYAGLYDFEYYEKVPGDGTLRAQIREFLGGSYEQIPDVYRRASPYSHVTAKAAPFLLMHGKQDRRVPFEQQEHFVGLLRGARASVEAIAIDNLTHASTHDQRPNPPYTVTEQYIYRFFDRHLKRGLRRAS